MEDDIIASLTRQVQEEVIENYLNERKLIDFQVEELSEKAKEVKKKARKTGKRITRVGYLLVDDSFRKEWADLARIPQDTYWYDCLINEFSHDVRFIKVTALTHRGKFKKLFHEAYKRLITRMGEYQKIYEDFCSDCRAVNLNIKQFHANYDILTIIRFLKSMDVYGLERKKILGENFSPDELMSIDEKLYFKPVKVESWDLPSPLQLPDHTLIEGKLDNLANKVYDRYGSKLKTIVK